MRSLHRNFTTLRSVKSDEFDVRHYSNMKKWPSIEYAEKVSDYFARNVANSLLFIPERDMSTEIIKLMKTDPVTSRILNQIESLFLKMDDIAHYDGSGWHDFKMCVLEWVKEKESNISSYKNN